MLIDQRTLFSDAQAIRSDSNSTNVIDLGVVGRDYLNTQLKRNLGLGQDIPLLVQVVTTFVGITSLNVLVQGSNTVKQDGTLGGTPATIASQRFAKNLPEAGDKLPYLVLPRETKFRYIHLRYDVTGTPTAGAITAGIVGAIDEGYKGNVG